jgi:hypothetical protein
MFYSIAADLFCHLPRRISVCILRDRPETLIFSFELILIMSDTASRQVLCITFQELCKMSGLLAGATCLPERAVGGALCPAQRGVIRLGDCLRNSMPKT